MDQVGVKAPGRPRRMMFFLLQRAARSIFSGGKPKSSVIPAGIASPTATTADESSAWGEGGGRARGGKRARLDKE